MQSDVYNSGPSGIKPLSEEITSCVDHWGSHEGNRRATLFFPMMLHSRSTCLHMLEWVALKFTAGELWTASLPGWRTELWKFGVNLKQTPPFTHSCNVTVIILKIFVSGINKCLFFLLTSTKRLGILHIWDSNVYIFYESVSLFGRRCFFFFFVLPAESSADSCFLLPTLVFITQRSRFQKAPR